ncbi:signal transduction histidine kinase [Allocatelliglobosispora scoriae]|uniref:histidine kinase n=1 Tax=Allocatelliglobosispora scoriae TaxID=643052 RepID=A0A841BQA9_9ACTN|nr:sensor domain-containing protein [Allocatelliglobosispora scoriae]MBB5868942.1 signal transduction histidine kinase [Allocatelliglobosispora scoriae]
MTGRWTALVRGVQLYGVALLGLVGFVFTIASFIPGFGFGLVFSLPLPILASRRLARLARLLTHRWTGVAIGDPYLPEPPEPVRQPDGWYRHQRQLYRKPWMPRLMLRLEWVLGDNATWRDLGWMLLAPFTGGLIGLLPAFALVGGVSLPWWGPGGVPTWLLVALGLGAAGLGVAVAPWTLAACARFNRRMLGGALLRSDVDDPSERRHPIRAWFGRTLLPAFRLTLLFLTSMLAIPVFVVTILGLLGGFGLGIYFLVPAVLEDFRWLADMRRSMARWTGGRIASPYRILPPLQRRIDDGLYQVEGRLYESQRWAAFNQRSSWLLKDPATWREVLWRGVDPIVGGLIAFVPAAGIIYGIWGLALPRVTQTLFGVPEADWYGHVAGYAWPAIPAGLLLAVGTAKLAPPLLRLHGRWTRLLLGPTNEAALTQRVEQLTQTRAEASQAQASELRRIERDLHDGAQARLVAVGMSLATIEKLMETDPQAARELLARTRESAATALRELRELVRGIHPPVLAERGLGDAVRALALDSPLSVTVTVRLPQRLPEPIEAAAYFAVAEALGNAARHAEARTAAVVLAHEDDLLRITVRDDGRGGADPTRGSGLRGLARRLGIFDGTVDVASPPGGPTVLTMEIPCASSSPRTSSS